MTTPARPRDGKERFVLRRCADNVGGAFRVLLRPARVSHSIWEYTLRQFVVATVLGLTIIVLTMVFIDAAAIRAMPRLPDGLHGFFEWFTDFGKSGWFLWPLGVLFLLLAAAPCGQLTAIGQAVLAAMMVRVGFLFLAIALPGLFVAVIKRVIGRARPMVLDTPDPFAFYPLGKWAASYASLPSGHTTTVFSVLVAFGTVWPQARPLLWVYALLMAVSRVAVTAHYPSDVIAGAVVGALGALMVRRYFALRHLGFSVTRDGAFHRYPGPSPRRIKAVARRLVAQ